MYDSLMDRTQDLEQFLPVVMTITPTIMVEVNCSDNEVPRTRGQLAMPWTRATALTTVMAIDASFQHSLSRPSSHENCAASFTVHNGNVH